MNAHNFSHNSIIQNWEPYIKARADAAIAKIRDEARQEPSDIFNWSHLLANEIMGKIAFGEDFGLIEAGEVSETSLRPSVPLFLKLTRQQENETLKYIHKGAMLGFLRVEWGMLHKLMQKLNLPMFREHFEAPVKFFQHARKATFTARSSNLQSANIFSAILAAQEKDTEAISDDVISIEAECMMTGGSDTTKANMTYLIYEVLRRPEWRDRLENEVAQLPPDYTNSDLEALPFLNAVLYETLRCHSGAPGSLRRTAPRDGATLGGHFVPRGTGVGTQAYSLNRDAHMYPNPDM
jgi:cytochrome P450